MKTIKTALILIYMLFLDFAFFSVDASAMHISEGILPFKWAVLWLLAAIPFLILGIIDIKKKSKKTTGFKPLLALIGAMVFIISCMPIPVPTAGTCSHPCGTGISAILLGPIASIFVSSIALLFQALFLAHGGLTTWGADIVSMGIAGSFAGYIAFRTLRRFNVSLFISGFAAGLLADWATYTVTSFELASALHKGEHMFPLFAAIISAFIPTQLTLGIMEGLATGGMIVFVNRRRPDILASLGVIKKPARHVLKNGKKIMALLFVCLCLTGNFAFAQDRWGGVDESVVEKIAEEHGRKAWTPFINTDQGDLLLFVFLLSGVAGGFILGYNFRRLFIHSPLENPAINGGDEDGSVSSLRKLRDSRRLIEKDDSKNV